MIESAANAKFKRIQKLMKQARARKKEGVFVVEGWKMVREALQRNLVQELYCDEKEEQALAKELAKLQKVRRSEVREREEVFSLLSPCVIFLQHTRRQRSARLFRGWRRCFPLRRGGRGRERWSAYCDTPSSGRFRLSRREC